MRMKKRGVSLIVLVITIVVVVILAVAVILSIANNNPIENAKKAAFFSDMSVLQEELSMYINNKLIDSKGEDVSIEYSDISEILPSIKDEYKSKIVIENGKLQWIDTSNMQEYNWAKEAFEGISTNLEKVEKNESSLVEVSNAAKNKLENLKIYGNSIQNGEPTPDDPIEIESVGELVTDESDANYGKYKIPITVSGKNLFDISNVTKLVGPDYKQNRNGYGSISDGIVTSKIGVYGNSAVLYDSKISLPAGTYTVSADFMADKDSGDKGITIGICFPNLYKTNASHLSVSKYRVWERKSHTFTLDEETEIAILVQGTGKKDDYLNLNIKIKNIQLEKGETPTEYEPYYNETYNIYLNEPLRKVGDYADYIDFKNNKVVRNVKRVYIDSSISYRYDMADWSGFNNEWVVFQKNVTIKDDILAYSNKFKQCSTYALADYVFWLQTAKTYLVFNLKKIDIGATEDSTNAEILELGKKYIKNNSIYFDIITEQETEKITNLPEILLEKGNNIITVDTTVKPSNMEAIYTVEK